jgi:hypothetical protein
MEVPLLEKGGRRVSSDGRTRFSLEETRVGAEVRQSGGC